MIEELLNQPVQENNNKKLIVIQGLSGSAGVWWFRVKQFYDYITRNDHPTIEFKLIDKPFTEEDLPLLERASVVHVHRTVYTNSKAPMGFIQAIKTNGKLIVDMDDYWTVDSTHPLYNPEKNRNSMYEAMNMFKIADYVTVASDELAKQVKKYTSNVLVQYNTFNPRIDQFRDKRDTIERNPKIKTIGYISGSSHKQDFSLIGDSFSKLRFDREVFNKFRVLVAGWDMRGGHTQISFNKELAAELGTNVSQKLIEEVKAAKTDIDAVPSIPQELKDKYRGKMLVQEFIPIQPHQTPYFFYEQLMSDTWKLVQGDDSKQLLFDNFSLQTDIHLPELSRIWTKPVESYCNAYDYADIVIAPLKDTPFNRSKSALKMIEAATRALPIIVSDVAPYQEIGVNGKNCIMVKNDSLDKKTAKNWYKAIKWVLQNPEKATEMGLQLQQDVKKFYNIDEITMKRLQLYESLIEDITVKPVLSEVA